MAAAETGLDITIGEFRTPDDFLDSRCPVMFRSRTSREASLTHRPGDAFNARAVTSRMHYGFGWCVGRPSSTTAPPRHGERQEEECGCACLAGCKGDDTTSTTSVFDGDLFENRAPTRSGRIRESDRFVFNVNQAAVFAPMVGFANPAGDGTRPELFEVRSGHELLRP